MLTAAYGIALLLQVAPAPSWPLDGALTLGAGFGWLALDQAHADWVHTRCPCDPSDVNPLDRGAVDHHFGAGERLADVTVGVALVAPLVVLAAVSPDGRAYADDALLVVESVAFAGLLTQGAKTLVGRPYPYMYGPAPYPEQNADGVNYASFWSGHTATPMAAAVSLAVIVDARRPHDPWRWVAWTVGPALALAAGALQVSAGNHFVTDVAAGAAVGAAVGWANTALRVD